MAKKKARAVKKTSRRSSKKAPGKKLASSAKAKGRSRKTTTSALASEESQRVQVSPEKPALDLEAIDVLRAVGEQVIIRVKQEFAADRAARDTEIQEIRTDQELMRHDVLDIQAWMVHFKESQRQPVEDKSLPSDADPAIVERRRMLAGFCKHLKLEKPTPAILGRALDQEKAYESKSLKSPYFLFDAILKNYLVAAGSGAIECPHLAPGTVERLKGTSGHSEAANEKHYRQQCDNQRMPLLVNTGLAKMEKNNRGEFDRYLSVEGRECFNGWPGWADASGGLSLADPPPPPGSTEPGSPETDGPAAAAGEGRPLAGGSIDASPPESPDGPSSPQPSPQPSTPPST